MSKYYDAADLKNRGN